MKEASTTSFWKMSLNGANTNMLPEGEEWRRAECWDNCGADMSTIILNVLSFLKNRANSEEVLNKFYYFHFHNQSTAPINICGSFEFVVRLLNLSS